MAMHATILQEYTPLLTPSLRPLQEPQIFCYPSSLLACSLFWAYAIVPSTWKAILPSVLSLIPLPPPGLLFIFPVRLALTILFKIITPTSPPGTHCSGSTAYSLTPFITSLIFTLLSSPPDMPYILCICLLSFFIH